MLTVGSVAALCVDAHGPYPDLVADWYDAERDARTFPGGMPVVAHPPCGPWGRLRHLCTKQDPELGPLCVQFVRDNGGVLEHPASSTLWAHCGMPRPGHFPDEWGGMSFECYLSAFGARMAKRTWLYVVGATEWPAIPRRDRGRETHVVCTRVRGGIAGGAKPRVSKPERRATPPAMARWLVDLASWCSPAIVP